MNAEKRRRDDVKEETDNKREKVEVVREEEVEEFFAILRRIHVAVKYFEKAEGSGRKLTAKKMNSWKPSFQVEDFEKDDGVRDGAVDVDDHNNSRREDLVEESSGLDLNSEPIFEVE
ncbi:hypothetical protein L6164_001751 [Bauhinia variegata]|uniref:Uncharacterized protein n=1 Tax=Bauhinia variegata TaxID=167791 RepID=A0ACB9QAR1_BAUVA|nr:hypothetical protein L6164_001751 [Bauhinia variegata]